MIVILRSKTGKADPEAKALALGGALVQYRPSSKAAVSAVRVEAESVADALALAGSAWVHAASGSAEDVAALIA